VASYQGLTLNNRRLKVGWGKNSGPLSPALALAVHSGATRNVYIGGIEDFELFNEERLKRDFGEYGDIELVNYLKEKYVEMLLFVLFCSDNMPPGTVPLSTLRTSRTPSKPSTASRTNLSTLTCASHTARIVAPILLALPTAALVPESLPDHLSPSPALPSMARTLTTRKLLPSLLKPRKNS
jgi:hypothetical protein